MKRNMARRQLYVLPTLCWLLLTPPVFVQAQSAVEDMGGPQPPKLMVTTLQYNSVFNRYHGYDEIQPGSWREANDSVGRIGGWRFYAQETGQDDDVEETKSPVTPKQPNPLSVSPSEKKSSGNQTHAHEVKP